jgi:hypothetical protein
MVTTAQLPFLIKNACVSPKVISGLGATRTLLPEESGALVLFDKVDGITITLPAPAIGLVFDFIVTKTLTSVAYEIDTDAAATKLMGAINNIVDNSATSKGFQGNGTSHVKVVFDGATKGGTIGSRVRATCVSLTQWSIDGNVMGVGAPATPFA